MFYCMHLDLKITLKAGKNNQIIPLMKPLNQWKLYRPLTIADAVKRK